MPDTLVELARRYRSALDTQDERALQRLVEAYRLMYGRLEVQLEALLDKIDLQGGITKGQLYRLQRYKSFMTQIEREVTAYSKFLETEIGLSTDQSVRLGLQHSRNLSRAALEDRGIAWSFTSLPANSVRSMLGFLSPGSPLYNRIDKLAGVQAERVREALISGIGLGYNPQKIAPMIRDAFGQGLTDALRMTRTANLWAYREAARANYMASGVVTQWQWWAELDDRTCEACIAMHGTIHDNSEPLDGHYNCRCTEIPYIEGVSPDRGTGEEWFNSLSEEEQRAILGPGKYDAWKAEQFKFSDLAKRVPDDTYGSMTTAAALYELLGAEPPLNVGE